MLATDTHPVHTKDLGHFCLGYMMSVVGKSTCSGFKKGLKTLEFQAKLSGKKKDIVDMGT